MMKNYLCWNPDTVRQVINPFAEHIPDGLFRAVHTDWDLRVTPPVGKSFQDIAESAWQDMRPSDFLEDFLRQERPHALAAILGETGSGKSHLVHWMRLNVRENQNRMVLVVRKSGTSLRAIVREIIDRLPADEQESFLDTFNAAGDGVMSSETRKHELLNHLAQAIREDHAEPGVTEIEAELMKALPNLLQDPYMRKAHLMRDERVVAEIVDHIFAESNAKNRPDRRKQFTSDDLQFGGMDFAHATRLAKDAIELIEIDAQSTLDILNRNLDRAVARTLSFSGDRIEELMARLRTYLKGQGKELVLLVEEFARLQGIDRPLLQAITSHGDEQQCRMRTAIAVSTGFFASVAATAYMRTTHIVDMDKSAGRAEGAEVTPSSLSEFAARYLNATRLGRERIEEWNETARPHDSAPSKCSECPHKIECHETFGSVGNYGLYPFTGNALWNAARRVDGTLPVSLNPRVLQNDLLVEVLDNFAPTIRTGEFPPPKLLEKLGGVKELGLPEETELEAKSQHNAGRWKAFLEIYDGSGNIINLPDSLRSAFTIPEIPNTTSLSSVPHAPDKVDVFVQSAGSTPQATASPEDLAIESWTRGKGLDETVANRLRELLFRAIQDFIDWDMLGLARAEFSGKTSGPPFRQISISFERQNTRVPSYIPVNLQIRADTLTGQALQGLLKAGRNKFRWNFDNGDRAMSAFLRRLEEWSSDVSIQLQKVANPSPDWNPALAALELLAVGSAIVGRLKSGATIADTVNAAFAAGSWSDDPPCSTPEMRGLYNKIFKNREALISLARSQLSSMKGGQAGSMLNPRLVVPPIRSLRRGKWKFGRFPLESDSGMIAKLYREVAAGLEGAAKSEQTLRTNWLREMESAFGPDLSKATLISTIEKARTAALDAGVAQSTGSGLANALDLIKPVQFDAALVAAREISNCENALDALPQFGRGSRPAVEAGSTLRIATEKFLDTVERNMEVFTGDQTAVSGDLQASIESIEKSLNEITQDLSALQMRGEVTNAS